MVRWIFVAGALALAVGCASAVKPRWVKEGVTPQQADKDNSECMAQATISGDVADPRERERVVGDFENCMYNRGYKRVLP